MPEPERIETLGDALPKEMERVRKLMKNYEAIGPAGTFACAMMKHDLDTAQRAISEGDTVAMLRVYQSLKGFEK